LRLCIENIAENIIKLYSNVLSDKEKKVWEANKIIKLLSKYEEHIGINYKLYVTSENSNKKRMLIGEHIALPKDGDTNILPQEKQTTFSKV